MVRLFNTMTRRLEEFAPIDGRTARFYTCGPTVYNFAHIGNFRAYVFEDILRRTLRYAGYAVCQVMNLTDVEDKIIAGARARGVDIFTYTQPYIEAFFEDLDTLRIERAEHYPRATEYIPQMVEFIKRLRQRGHTYEVDGSIYFRLASFPAYGRLSGNVLDQVKVGARVDQDEYDLEDARDFVLWKAAKEGEHYWETELGKGRPGWHIECSTMARELLGEHIDIHTGGEDNIFPHHENEIAQTCCAYDTPFVNIWMHTRHLLVNGEKMSKSKGNFYTLRDLVARGHHPLAIRFFLISQHYRVPLNLTEEALAAAASGRERLVGLAQRLTECAGAGASPALDQALVKAAAGFCEALFDDLQTARALAAVFDFVAEANRALAAGGVGREQAERALAWLRDIDRVLAVLPDQRADPRDVEVEALLQRRQHARAARDWAAADAIRDQLASMGVVIEDTAAGVRWRWK